MPRESFGVLVEPAVMQWIRQSSGWTQDLSYFTKEGLNGFA